MILGAVMGLVILLIIAVSIIGGGKDKNGVKENHIKRMQEACDKLNDRNVDIMVFGDDFMPPANLKYRRVYGLDDSSLDYGRNRSASYRMLVINDPKGELNIPEDNWALIAEKMKANNFYLVILSPNKFGIMQAFGIISSPPTHGTKSMIIWNSGRNREPGFADNPELVPYYVEEDLQPEQIPGYTMIMELSTYDRFWT